MALKPVKKPVKRLPVALNAVSPASRV